MFLIFEKDNILPENIKFLLYIMILSLIINIKFNAFAYAGLYCLGYYLWYIVRLKKNKEFKKFFIKFSTSSFIALIIGVFIIGLSVYPKNQIEKGNLFYPLYGDGKIDIMESNQPKSFKDKYPIEKFVIANFSKSDNISKLIDRKTQYKLPFTFYKSEFKQLSSCDLRLGGYGIFFSGILVLSIILICLNIKSVYKKDKTIFMLTLIPIIITLLLTFTLGESWWARYFPQLYFIPLFAILYSNFNDRKYNQIIGATVILILLINNLLIFGASSFRSYLFTQRQNELQTAFESVTSPKECQLELNTTIFHGALYNVRDKEKDYNIIYTDKENENQEYNVMFDPYVSWSCKK